MNETVLASDPSKQSPAAPLPHGPVSAFVALLICVAAGLYSYLVIGQSYWCDDAFISFRFARNLADGNGLVFNIGDKVEGYTNFLWTVLAALGIKLGFEPIRFAQYLSLGAQAATLGLVYRIGVFSLKSAPLALFAPLFLACNVGFLSYAMSGMETSFYIFAVTLCAWMLLTKKHHTTRGSILLGVVWLIMALTRFDGFVLAFAMAAFQVLVRRQFRVLMPATLLFLIGMAIYHAWRYSYYGHMFPNTFYAKVGFSMGRTRHGMGYLAQFIWERGVVHMVLALLPIALLRLRGAGTFLLWTVCMQLVFVLLVGEDWFPHFRFMLPVTPLLCLLAQEGAVVALKSGPSAVRLRTGLLLALGLGLMMAYPTYKHRALDGMSGPHFFPRVARTIGEYINENIPKDKLIAIEWGGVMPFYFDQPALDTFGLTDRKIVDDSQKGVPNLRRQSHGIKLNPQYLAQRKPDYIAFCARIFPTLARAKTGTAPRTAKKDKGPCHYSYYPEMKGHGYKMEFWKIDDKGFWPVMVRVKP